MYNMHEACMQLEGTNKLHSVHSANCQSKLVRDRFTSKQVVKLDVAKKYYEC